MSGPNWVSDHSPLSPEARRRLNVAERTGESEARWFHRLRPGQKSVEVVRRVLVGVYNDGFQSAGNFAYLSLLAIFAFFIVAAAIAGLFGRTEAGLSLIQGFLQTLPASVADTLREPIANAMRARSGPLVWLSALVSLWTTGSLMETIRGTLHSAYGTRPRTSFLHYRLGSLLVIIGAVIVAMVAFSAQVLMSAINQFLARFTYLHGDFIGWISIGRLVPFLILFGAFYLIFRMMTPHRYRARIYPKWPGAALVSLWWVLATEFLPFFLSYLFDYDLTYGSLAGAVITLLFFYIIGLGMVTAAELNAALANHVSVALEGEPDVQELII